MTLDFSSLSMTLTGQLDREKIGKIVAQLGMKCEGCLTSCTSAVLAAKYSSDSDKIKVRVQMNSLLPYLLLLVLVSPFEGTTTELCILLP